MTDFSWNRACRLPWVSLTAEERAAGWPAALTLENFASMQFPMEGDESARRTARKDRAALLATMREAIAARELDAEERRRAVQRVVDDGRLFEPIPLASSPLGGFERAREPRPRRTITEIETRHAITREAAAEFLAAQGIEPGEHIRAWLRPLVQAAPAAAVEQHQGEDALAGKGRPGRKPTDARALLVQILDALEGFAAATGQDFDRERMPGPLGESAADAGSFHWLCASIYPRAFIRAKATFAKHRAGICALGNYAKQTDFYRQALPHIAPKLGVKPNVHHMPRKRRKSA